MTEQQPGQSPVAPHWCTPPRTVPAFTLEEYGIKTTVPVDEAEVIINHLKANVPFEWLKREIVWKVIEDYNLDMDTLWPAPGNSKV